MGTAPADSLTTNSATFNSTGTVSPVLATSQSVQGLSFSTQAYTFSSSGGAVLTIGGGGITHTNFVGLTISSDIALGANQTWSTQASASRNINMSSAAM